MEWDLVFLAELSKVTGSPDSFRGLPVPDDESLDVERQLFGSQGG